LLPFIPRDPFAISSDTDDPDSWSDFVPLGPAPPPPPIPDGYTRRAPSTIRVASDFPEGSEERRKILRRDRDNYLWDQRRREEARRERSAEEIYDRDLMGPSHYEQARDRAIVREANATHEAWREWVAKKFGPDFLDNVDLTREQSDELWNEFKHTPEQAPVIPPGLNMGKGRAATPGQWEEYWEQARHDVARRARDYAEAGVEPKPIWDQHEWGRENAAEKTWMHGIQKADVLAQRQNEERQKIIDRGYERARNYAYDIQHRPHVVGRPLKERRRLASDYVTQINRNEIGQTLAGRFGGHDGSWERYIGWNQLPGRDYGEVIRQKRFSVEKADEWLRRKNQAWDLEYEEQARKMGLPPPPPPRPKPRGFPGQEPKKKPDGPPFGQPRHPGLD
jgi:hypothetical protein